MAAAILPTLFSALFALLGLFCPVCVLFLPLCLQTVIPKLPVIAWPELGQDIAERWHRHSPGHSGNPLGVVWQPALAPLVAQEPDVCPDLLGGHVRGAGEEVISVELKCRGLH